MSVQATIQQQLTVIETLATGVPDVAAGGGNVRHDQFNVGPLTLNASSTPPAAQVASEQLTGSASYTLDLTALSGTNGASINGTGQKVQAVQIVNPATNAGAVTVAPGASNPYPLWGAGDSVVIPLGGSINLQTGGNSAAIGATAKTLLITPAAAGDKINVVILLG